MIFFNLSYNQLLLYGVHIGHSFANTLLYSSWMVSVFRQSLSIINLFKSIIMFRLSFLILTNIIALQGPIWFINLDKSVDRYVKHAAFNCGEFSVTSRWIRGAISNYRVVFNAYRRLMHLSGTILSSKNRSFATFFSNWFLSRYSWPRAIFISSLHTSYAAAKEAATLKIPAISIVDTNSWTQAASLAIPGNDESLGCLVFYNDILSNFILARKFNLVSIWFFNVRSISRIVNFVDWVSTRFSIEGNVVLSNVIQFKPNLVNNYFKSMGLFLSKGYWVTLFKDKLDLFHPAPVTFDAAILLPTFLAVRKTIIMTLNFHFVKKVLLFKGFYKKNFLTESNFKQKFLKKGFFTRTFLRERYLKSGLIKRDLRVDLLVAIANYFFLSKYLNKLALHRAASAKLTYWDKITTIIMDKFSSKATFWKRPIEISQRSKQLRFVKHVGNSVDINSVKPYILLARSDFIAYKLKFFLSTTSFDSYIPKHLWFWNLNYFVPETKSVPSLSRGYFFKKFYVTRSNVGRPAYFKGLLNLPVTRKSFTGKFHYKWVWY